MPRKSKKKNDPTNTPGNLWSQAGGDNIMLLLMERFPENRWSHKGAHIGGCCPFHDDSTASFMVTPDKGIAKCFGCGIVFLDLLAFVKRLMGGSSVEAAKVLRKRFNLKTAVTDTQFEALQTEEIAQAHLLKFFNFCGQVMTDAPGV